MVASSTNLDTAEAVAATSKIIQCFLLFYAGCVKSSILL